MGATAVEWTRGEGYRGLTDKGEVVSGSERKRQRSREGVDGWSGRLGMASVR